MTPNAGQQFLEGSRLQIEYKEPSEQDRGLPQPPLELAYLGPNPLVDLPEPAGLDLGRVDLRQALEGRRTVRKYSQSPLSLAELSFLLWCTQGVKEVTARPATRRLVPSAGGRHAFETYLLINRVEGVAPGLYRFLAIEHKLVALSTAAEMPGQIEEACLRQDHVGGSAVTFFWTCVFARMRWRYGERGYRYLFLDAGHVCQNLYLAAGSIACGVCAIGAFDDVRLNRALELDGVDHFAVYGATVGKLNPAI